LITIRRKQLKIFEDLTMFEQRILCHKLPKSFDSIHIDIHEEKCVNRYNKIIRDTKRRLLNVELERYEIKIQHYEHLYQQDLIAFKTETLKNNSSYQIRELDMLMHIVKTYLYHHTNILMRRIRFKESYYHVKLTRRHHRQLLSTTKQIIDVYPQIIVDIPKISLNRIQLDYLSHNGKLKLLFNSYLCYNILFSYRTELYQNKSNLSLF
jgi:hypothetical protein